MEIAGSFVATVSVGNVAIEAEFIVKVKHSWEERQLHNFMS